MIPCLGLEGTPNFSSLSYPNCNKKRNEAKRDGKDAKNEEEIMGFMVHFSSSTLYHAKHTKMGGEEIENKAMDVVAKGSSKIRSEKGQGWYFSKKYLQGVSLRKFLGLGKKMVFF